MATTSRTGLLRGFAHSLHPAGLALALMFFAAFGPDAAQMWVAILQPQGWTSADTDRVHAVLAGRE